MKSLINKNIRISSLTENISQSGVYRKQKEYLSIFLFRNKRIIVFSAILILLGSIIGGIVYTTLPQTMKNQIFSYTQNYFLGSIVIGSSHTEIFKSVMTNHIITSIIILLSGIFIFLSPLCFIKILSKGFTMGFTLTFLIGRYGAKGIIFSIVAIVLSNAISICNMIWFTAAANETLKDSRFILKKSKYKKGAKLRLPSGKSLVHLITCYTIFLAISLISSPIECVVCPDLLKFLYSVFSKFA